MSELKTDYVNDELAISMGGKRRYRMIENSDGTVSFEDVTSYSVVGDEYDADDINRQNEVINQLNNDLTDNSKAFKFGYQNSQYGYYDSSNVFHPFKSGLEETTLWTNSSPSSNFSAQTINLSKSMDNFDYLRFEFNLATNDTKKTIVIVPVDWFKTTASNSNVGGCAFYSSTPRSRIFYYSSTTAVYFNNGYSSGTPAASTCIPVSIKGLK